MIKCDPRAKAICPFKNPCCGDETAYFVEGSECDEFNQKILAPPPTNADRIRSMTDDELNEMFHEIYNAGAEDAVAYEWGQRTNSFEWTMDWLQQPSEEVNNG